MAAKQFHRITQLAGERFAGREKSDRLTESLSEAEKKAELIKTGCLLACKKLSMTMQGSGSTIEKHQKKIPQYSLGNGMIDAGRNLGPTVLGNVLRLVGQGELDISLQVADYEQCLDESVTSPLAQMIEEEMKKIDKLKKKLSSARVDMDSTRNRYQSLQDKYSPKAEAIKNELDQAINNFEQSQDAYATNLFAFLSREREIALKIHKLVVLQITRHKQALAILEAILPHIDGELDNTKARPVYGLDLKEHLDSTNRIYSYVIEECCLALREKWMDTEGLFRLAASSAKLKLLKNSFNAARSVDLNSHDPHTIAGALKQYLRELPDPLLKCELYAEWIAAAGTENEGERSQNLWSVKEKLPEENKENLRYLMHFLHDFSMNHKETKMNTNNIAIVIGPNLLWPKVENTGGLVGDTAFHTRIAECFIKYPEYFFGEAPDINIQLKPVKFTTRPIPPTKPGSLPIDSNEPSDNNGRDDDDDNILHRPDSIASEDSVTEGTITSQETNNDSRPTPPVRRSRSKLGTNNEPTTPTGSPKTPTGRPSRPAPQPPPSRPKTRNRPPSPPLKPSSTDENKKEETIL